MILGDLGQVRGHLAALIHDIEAAAGKGTADLLADGTRDLPGQLDLIVFFKWALRRNG